MNPYRVEKIAGFVVRHFAEVASTNTLALESREDGVVFVADAQMAGRGRRGAVWASAPGLGLWTSLALRLPPRDLGFAAALAARSAAAQMAPLGIQPSIAVKWPNDLLLAGRKVCGVLVEHRDRQSAVGIGLNVAHQTADFPPDLRASATSLAIAFGTVPDRDAVLTALLEAFRSRLDRIANGDGDTVFEEWRAALGIEGRTISRGDLRGVVEVVNRDGALSVRTQDAVVRVDAGAVEVVAQVGIV